MAANGTLAPTVVPMVNGGQASIAISNTSPNLFTVPGDRIIAVNSLDGALTNNEQTASGGVVVGRSCDDGADRWSGVVCRKIITPFLARGFFPDILRLSSGCAGRSGAVTGVVSLTVTG
ncbi:IncF transfer protein TraK (plasmid) [Escherichia coli UMNF18]|nr:IncF transfer protein TraK [Escherichia coli UMNF18]